MNTCHSSSEFFFTASSHLAGKAYLYLAIRAAAACEDWCLNFLLHYSSITGQCFWTSRQQDPSQILRRHKGSYRQSVMVWIATWKQNHGYQLGLRLLSRERKRIIFFFQVVFFFFHFVIELLFALCVDANSMYFNILSRTWLDTLLFFYLSHLLLYYYFRESKLRVYT